MLLGGAAVHRCDNDLVSDPASAAEVTKIAPEATFFTSSCRAPHTSRILDVWVPPHRMRRTGNLGTDGAFPCFLRQSDCLVSGSGDEEHPVRPRISVPETTSNRLLVDDNQTMRRVAQYFRNGAHTMYRVCLCDYDRW